DIKLGPGATSLYETQCPPFRTSPAPSLCSPGSLAYSASRLGAAPPSTLPCAPTCRPAPNLPRARTCPGAPPSTCPVPAPAPCRHLPRRTPVNLPRARNCLVTAPAPAHPLQPALCPHPPCAPAGPALCLPLAWPEGVSRGPSSLCEAPSSHHPELPPRASRAGSSAWKMRPGAAGTLKAVFLFFASMCAWYSGYLLAELIPDVSLSSAVYSIRSIGERPVLRGEHGLCQTSNSAARLQREK
uniref:Uncharacterized protein n=1 Tax=Equus asinus asinus TaxID=83772 RepID=A0A8C4LF83_EQUAS